MLQALGFAPIAYHSEEPAMALPLTAATVHTDFGKLNG